MANYRNLKNRMDNGDVIILDGAVGTELQAMGVPMHPVSWCAPGNYTHMATVRLMHERYIKAGADIITTNSFNAIRPALEASGYGELVREINTRSVDAAIEARNRAAGDREAYIAGSISCRIPIRDGNTGALSGGTGHGYGASIPADELRAYTDEQADILAESGIDFFLIEQMWADNESRVIATESAKATGLPVWVAFTASTADDGQTIKLDVGADRGYVGGKRQPLWTSNWRPVDYDMTLAAGIAEIAPLEPDVIGVFHATASDTTAALKAVFNQWSGPVVAYPDAGRSDYLQMWQDRGVPNEVRVEALTQEAAKWVEMGTQIVGTCCGYGVDYIKALRDVMPPKLTSPRKAA